jgi:acyl carrier protein
VPEGFDDDYNLVDGGLLDSLAIMNLITWLEKHFSIEFDDGDIVLEHFCSINALLDFMQRKHAADKTH